MHTCFRPDSISSEVIIDLVDVAWRTFVGVEPVPVGDGPAEGADPDVLVPGDPDDVVGASISIGGPWRATVLLRCSRAAAVAAAEAAFGVPAAEVAETDIGDVLGELANVIGGNLKGFASGDEDGWTLSLPVVPAGDPIVPGSRRIARVDFSCAGEPLACEVREHR